MTCILLVAGNSCGSDPTIIPNILLWYSSFNQVFRVVRGLVWFYWQSRRPGRWVQWRAGGNGVRSSCFLSVSVVETEGFVVVSRMHKKGEECLSQSVSSYDFNFRKKETARVKFCPTPMFQSRSSTWRNECLLPDGEQAWIGFLGCSYPATAVKGTDWNNLKHGPNFSAVESVMALDYLQFSQMNLSSTNVEGKHEYAGVLMNSGLWITRVMHLTFESPIIQSSKLDITWNKQD